MSDGDMHRGTWLRMACLGEADARHRGVECSVVPLQHRLAQDQGLWEQRLWQVDVHQHGHAALLRRRRPGLGLRRVPRVGHAAGRHVLLGHHLRPCIVGRVQDHGEVAKVDLELRSGAETLVGMRGRVAQEAHEHRPQVARHTQQRSARVHYRTAGPVVAEIHPLAAGLDANNVELPMPVVSVSGGAPCKLFTLYHALSPVAAKGDLALLLLRDRKEDREQLLGPCFSVP
mmetsp:Transcript_2047/g.5597  ORF Transcript_2047/g.5597 Transcript_2047/m.5597 type:complete len:230 (-) Transcript_2047:1063-1752(-)